MTPRHLPRGVPFAVAAGLVAFGNGLVVASRRSANTQLTTGAGMAAAVAFASVAAGAAGLRLREDIGLRPPDRMRPRWPLAIAGAGVVAGVALAAARHRHCADGPVAGVLARMLIATALGEEVLFRGVLLAVSSCAELSRSASAILDTTAFAAWHLAAATTDGRVDPLQVLAPGAGSVLFRWARRRYGTVLAPVLLHAMFNVPAWALTRCR